MSRPALRFAARLLAPAAAALVAACGGGDNVAGPNRPADAGSISGSIAGGVSRSIAGVAYYGQVTQGGESAFALGMGSLKPDSSFKDAVVIVREKRGVPGPGTYRFHDLDSAADPTPDEFMIISITETAGGQPMLCMGSAGTLTVESVSGGRMKGSYNTPATCVDPSNPDREVAATLAGSFEARENTRLTVPGLARLDGAAFARTR